jgi:hypothetical protein
MTFLEYNKDYLICNEHDKKKHLNNKKNIYLQI